MTNYGDEATVREIRFGAAAGGADLLQPAGQMVSFGRHALVADFNDRARELLAA
ncbi:hypothetical protein ABZW30_44025 [Kitasatospora sp. NPDC004669]|uniref:hypothetical protein n=1 Tax=Kitasatospora sp. NPDC004669 TaxID=3154555 RepID=UPI0033AE24B8